MILTGRVVFAALACATVAAFFVTQRLKREPSVVQSVRTVKFFSPNGDGVRDVNEISFQLKRSDDVTVGVVDADGSEVRRLASDRPARPYRPVRLRWDGDTGAGVRAPDGLYRLRIGLRRQGRSVTAPRSLRLDTRPPRPTVVAVRARPDGSYRVRIRGPGRSVPRFAVYRTDRTRPEVVARFSGRRGRRAALWDGRAGARPAPPGTYLVAARVADRAGNVGSAPERLPPRPGEVRGRPGISIRRLAAQPPLEPVRAGSPLTFFVNAAGRRYSWTVRRIGEPRPRRRGSARDPRLALPAPGRASGLYVLSLRSGRDRSAVPFLVQGRRSSPVQVVVPTITWQGLNQVDDDGDGLPNTLPAGTRVTLERVFASGLPADFDDVAALFAWLDDRGLRYDVSSDLALARAGAPRAAARTGLLLAGSVRWLPPGLAAGLRAYVRRGGRVASLGTEALRRGVSVGPARLARPTEPGRTDALGSRIGPLLRGPVALTGARDALGLFEGTDGAFAGFTAREETLDVGRGRILTSATTAAARPVLVAYRAGDGIVLRFGVPGWAQRLRGDAEVATVTRRVWSLLSR